MRDKNNFSSARFFATSTSILSLFFNALGEYPACNEYMLFSASQSLIEVSLVFDQRRLAGAESVQ